MNEFANTIITCKMLSNTNRENILKKLEKKEWLQFGDIKFALKLNSNTLAYHIEKLLASKMINKNQDRYYITEFGRNALEFIRGLHALVENSVRRKNNE